MGSAEMQGEVWGRAARDWADLQEPFHAPLWGAMLDAERRRLGVPAPDSAAGTPDGHPEGPAK